MSDKKITFSRGDGIGPEIMDVVLSLLDKVASIDFEEIVIGEKIYNKGLASGIEDASWESLHRTKVFLKAPITTPQGGGFRSLNVTIRKMLGLYANIRACRAYHPYVETKHPEMDITIIRENEEDLYTGIEYQQTEQVVQCLKLLSKRASEKIIRYAFEYARQHQKKRVTCFTKDNIMKKSDGMFHACFDEVAKDYKDIENEHWIVDIGMAKVADSPEAFEVVVVPNLYGDILSDITAQISGSVGLAGSSNIGEGYAMFEAIHGSAPRRAGQNMANPTGLLLAAIDMLAYLDLPEEASQLKNAWLKTLEDGLHTYDIYQEGQSKKKLGTKEFGQAVMDRLGEVPKKLKPAKYLKRQAISFKSQSKKPQKKELVGVDVFFSFKDQVEKLVKELQTLEQAPLKLKSVSSRGLPFWPGRAPLADKSDHWSARFVSEKPISEEDVLQLLSKITKSPLKFIKVENLYTFDGTPGFSTVSEL